jgi:ABC-type multidrug transport system fused ATPase/permease subunit
VKPRRGLLATGFLLMATGRLAGIVLPASTKFLIDDVLGKQRFDLLAPLIGAVVAATVVQGVAGFALTQLLSRGAQRLISELRQRVQAHVGHLPIAFFESHTTGALVSRIMNDVEGLRNLIGTGLVEFVGGLMTAAIALVIMARLSFVLTALTALFLALLAAILAFSLGRLRPVFRERGKITAAISGRLNESLSGIRVVKGYSRESHEESVFQAGISRLLANVIRTTTSLSALGLASTLLLGAVGAAVMYAGARQILAGALTLGGLFTYTVFLGFLVAPLLQIVSIGSQMTEALAGLERTRELLAVPREDADPRRVGTLGPLRGEVVFEEVGFSYDTGKPVLRAVSFRAAPGTITALVGPSGAGKSTIVGLIASFHTPGSGRVLVDGVDLATVRLDSYRSQLGVVFQESFLFDGTIRENIAFPRSGVTDELLLRAAKTARVDEFAESFPERYETVVGERGVKLSGGQKQRVSIARAVLADPRILILDEATSSLDTESELLIQEGLEVLMQGRTTFVIAHRLSTIRRADRILVVERGAIVASGTHAELLAQGGLYREMYERQHGVSQNLFLGPGEGWTA